MSIQERRGVQYVYCQCRDEDGKRCGHIIMTIINGVAMVPCEHNGRHKTPVTLADTQRLIEEDKKRRDPALQF